MSRLFASAALVLMTALPGFAEDALPDFGDNEGGYPFDLECDDPRFVGVGSARSAAVEETGHDASDCKYHYELGTVALWDEARARAATSCAAINFGDNSSDWANDGECDDPRFTGAGVDDLVVWDDLGRDARDCRKACDAGEALLRFY